MFRATAAFATSCTKSGYLKRHSISLAGPWLSTSRTHVKHGRSATSHGTESSLVPIFDRRLNSDALKARDQ